MAGIASSRHSGTHTLVHCQVPAAFLHGWLSLPFMHTLSGWLCTRWLGNGFTGMKVRSGNVGFTKNDLVAWYTHSPQIVAASSTKVEYVVVSGACKESLSSQCFIGESVHALASITICMEIREQCSCHRILLQTKDPSTSIWFSVWSKTMLPKGSSNSSLSARTSRIWISS